MATEQSLTKEDLILLMESYKNMITMHQAILSQSQKMIDSLDGITNKQDTLVSSLQVVTQKLDDCGEKLQGNITKIDKMEENIHDEVEKVGNTINGHEKKSIEEHGKITNKIYVGWVGMATIIVAVIGLTWKVLEFVHTHNIPSP